MDKMQIMQLLPQVSEQLTLVHQAKGTFLVFRMTWSRVASGMLCAKLVAAISSSAGSE